MIKIVLIDDHAVLREGLARLLSNLGDFEVVRQFENGNIFVDEFNDLKNNVDLFILDFSMPTISGLEILEKLQNDIQDEKFLILSQSIDEFLKFKFYSLGAKGFLSKTCTGEELKNAINEILNYGFYNINENLDLIKKHSNKFQLKDILTKKEVQFIELSCHENEYTYEQMSEIMNVSAKTIDYYRSNVFQKLNIKSKSGLILFSYKHKLTKPFM